MCIIENDHCNVILGLEKKKPFYGLNFDLLSSCHINKDINRIIDLRSNLSLSNFDKAWLEVTH